MADLKCISCGSCGMPMRESGDFALGNVASLYCSHCTDEEGKLLPYETVLKSNVHYYMSSQGIDESAATELAKNLLSTKPAWKRSH